MPPGSSEKSYTPESTQNLERYMEIERGDVSPVPSNNQTQQDPQQTGHHATNHQQHQQQKQFDPVEFVKSMISTGFTPTRAQIMNANNNLGGPQDSTNTWFAIFLQHLIKQDKLRRSKENTGR
jgi:hypothetical protein